RKQNPSSKCFVGSFVRWFESRSESASNLMFLDRLIGISLHGASAKLEGFVQDLSRYPTSMARGVILLDIIKADGEASPEPTPAGRFTAVSDLVGNSNTSLD
ncbi:uncharacterized protein VP01_14296g1, partial [Puccinia sorghi]